MIDYHERDGVIPLLEAVQKIQRGFPRFGSQNAVPLLVMPLQIALDGAKNIEVVVDGQDHWLLHIAIYRWRIVNEWLPREQFRTRLRRHASYNNANAADHQG